MTAGLTAFYMFRAYYMTFMGEFRGTHEQEHHLHESPPSMVIPLWILAVGAVLSGLVGIPRVLTLGFLPENRFKLFLEPVVASVLHAEERVTTATEIVLMLVAIAVATGGILAARAMYRDRGLEKGRVWAERFPAVHRVLVNKYWVDELYDATVIRGTWGLARLLFRFDAGFIDGFLVNGARNVTVAVSMVSGFFDKYVVDGLVNLTAIVLGAFSRLFRRLQTGYVGSYALVLAAGMFAMVVLYMLLNRG